MPDTSRTESALLTLFADNTSGAITAQMQRDFLVSLNCLCGPEISVTGTVTATIGQMHVCSGTSADYTVTLPAASGNGGRLIGFRMAPIASLSKLVTLDGNSSETIDGAITRIMWAGESVILACDGSNWFKIGGMSIPMMARGGRTSLVSGDISNVTTTLIPMNISRTDNTGRMVDTSGGTLVFVRAGLYDCVGSINYAATDGSSAMGSSNNTQVRLQKNTSTVVAANSIAYNSTWFPALQSEITVSFAVGDTLGCYAYQQSSSNVNIYTAGTPDVTWLSASEIIQW